MIRARLRPLLVAAAFLTLAPAALASEVTFELNASMSSPWWGQLDYIRFGLYVTGEARAPQEGPVEKTDFMFTSYHGGPWLTEMSAANNLGINSASIWCYLAGRGPNPQAGPGYLYQYAQSVYLIFAYGEGEYYYGPEPPPKPSWYPSEWVPLEVSYNYSVTLNQSGGNNFIKGAWQSELNLYRIGPKDSMEVFSQIFPLVNASFSGTDSWSTGFWAEWGWEQRGHDEWWAGTIGYAWLVLDMRQAGYTVPLPGSLLLLGGGLAALAGFGRNRWL